MNDKKRQNTLFFAYENAGTDTLPQEAELRQFMLNILASESFEGDVNVIFTSDAKIRSMNREFRKLDKTTDVLSFEWHEDDFLGEIYISLPQVIRQAPRYDNSIGAEIFRVLAHGTLHLCGYDHMNSKDRKLMRNTENEYLAKNKRAVPSP